MYYSNSVIQLQTWHATYWGPLQTTAVNWDLQCESKDLPASPRKSMSIQRTHGTHQTVQNVNKSISWVQRFLPDYTKEYTI